jgi:hypothetical protein
MTIEELKAEQKIQMDIYWKAHTAGTEMAKWDKPDMGQDTLAAEAAAYAMQYPESPEVDRMQAIKGFTNGYRQVCPALAVEDSDEEEELTPAEIAELEALMEEPTLGPYTLEELEAMLTLGITPEDMSEFRARNKERGTAPGYEY